MLLPKARADGIELPKARSVEVPMQWPPRQSRGIFTRGLKLDDLRQSRDGVPSPRSTLRRRDAAAQGLLVSSPSVDSERGGGSSSTVDASMVDRAWSTLLAGPPPQKSFGKLTNWDKVQYGDSMRPTLPPISTLASEMGGTPRTLRAAQRWDETQKQRQGRAERLYQAMERSGSAACLRTPTNFNRSLQDIRTSRIWVREEAPPPKPIERKVVVVQAAPDHEVVGEEWSLPVSIWAPRRASADSRDFHDTDALRQQCLDMDWKLALADHNTKAYIEELERSTPESVEAVYLVLRDVYPLVIGIYDYYCTLGPAGDDNVFEIAQYGYKKLLEDTCLVVPGSKFSSSTAFDQLFKLVNAQTENVRALNRQKWLQILIRIAGSRYVLSEPPQKGGGKGEAKGDVAGAGGFAGTLTIPEAFERLLRQDMAKVPAWSRHDAYQFRETQCYIQDVDAVLREWEPSLRAIFKVYSEGDGVIGDETHSKNMMEHYEWRLLLRDLQLNDESFKLKEATMVFVVSRMRVIDERAPSTRPKLTQLHFEDFLEALVLISTLKVLPTAEQVFDAGSDDAFEFLLGLKDAAQYDGFIKENMQPRDAPLREPIFVLLECLCGIIVQTVEHEMLKERAGQNYNQSRKQDSDGFLSDKEVAQFRTQCHKRYGSLS